MRNGRITLRQAAQWCGGRVAPQWQERTFCGANMDTRRLRPGELFVAMTGGARDGHGFAAQAMERGAAAVLASSPLPPEIPALYVEDTLAALQAIAGAYRRTLRLKAIGVTGSVGKTTTKDMIAAALATTLRTQKTPENFNNEIGLPLSVLALEADCEAAVLEMGMNHFGELSRLTRIAQPDIAVITNVGTMHIENLGSREGILKAKLEILEGLRPDGIAVFHGDDDMLAPAAAQYHALTFGLREGNDVSAQNIRTEGGKTRFTALAFGEEIEIELPTVGTHNVLDALCAVAVALRCGVKPERLAAGLASFQGSGMRQRIFARDGVTVIEDCYNAGPESMRAALGVLAQYPGRRLAVLGGMLELGDYAPQAHYALGREAAQTAQLLLAYGAGSEETVRGAKDAGLRQAWYFDTHEALAKALRGLLRSGDTLLLKGSRGMRMERVLELLDTATTGGKENG